jgi:hypothetical protein
MKVGRSELKRRATDILRKGLTDALLHLIIDSLWRDADEIVRIVNVSINNSFVSNSNITNNSTTNIYNTIRSIVNQQAENNHESYLIENTAANTVTQESSWSVEPFDQQVGEFKAVVMIRNKATDTIITLMSLLSFDYSETPGVSTQNDLLTGAATLTVSVSAGNKLKAVVTGMAGDNKRIHICFERCVMGMRASDMEANGLFELDGVANLVLAEFVDITASGSLELDGTAIVDELVNVAALGELELNGVAEITDSPNIPSGMRLTWDNIANVPVENPESVAEWNDWFDLPNKGSEFTSVAVDGNIIFLDGSTGITIRSNLFENTIMHCTKFEDIGGIVTSVEDYGFQYCELMTLLSLPSLTEAGNYSFYQIGGGLESGYVDVQIPNLITAGEYCFGNAKMEIINFPVLVSAGFGCFSGCLSATTVYLPAIETLGVACFGGCILIESFDLPNLTLLESQSIEGGTPDAGGQFSGCTSAISFNIPLVTHIPALCFQDCTSATTFNLDAVESIGFYAFGNCTSCIEFNFPALKSIDGSFQSCTAATTFNFPLLETVTGDAFYNCTSCVEFDFPELTSLSGMCFADCTSATTFNFPALLYIYYSSCFSGCVAATSFNMPQLLQLGGSVYNNSIFYGIIGNTISITIPAALMTAVMGTLPDFDIQGLQASNTVTVITT